jgi:2-polyprenyl-3-methyl-5-hydroxy-6-metoxy-1,4-benzoquinol methylase
LKDNIDATNMNVAQAYDRIAEWFDSTRTRALIEQPYLDALVQVLQPGASILDLGCGSGEPILRFLVEQGFAVTGVDASEAMIALATPRFPDARLLVDDMRTVEFDRRFDGVIAWHSLFHLPHADQRRMFAGFAQLLNPHGILMFTSGSAHGETWSDWYSAPSTSVRMSTPGIALCTAAG